MGQIEEVCFWQEGVSAHTADLIAAFAESHSELRVVSYSGRSQRAQQQEVWEWEQFGLAPAETRFPTLGELPSLLRPEPSRVHIFCGYRAGSFTREFAQAGKRAGVAPLIMSEPGADGFPAGQARVIRSWLCDGYFRRRSPGVLAIGANGPRWFRRAGFPSGRVLPFGYFMAPPKFDLPVERGTGAATPRIGFLGRLVPMKGLADLMGAMELLGPTARLDVVGDGELRGWLSRSAPPNVSILGALPHPEVWRWLSTIDCLVLPSRSDDGWGVAASEALLQGVPVIVTEKVGASIVLERHEFGARVPPKSPAMIAAAIQTLLTREGSLSARADRAAHARSSLSAQAGAEYLWRAILFAMGWADRPAPPWGGRPDGWSDRQNLW